MLEMVEDGKGKIGGTLDEVPSWTGTDGNRCISFFTLLFFFSLCLFVLMRPVSIACMRYFALTPCPFVFVFLPYCPWFCLFFVFFFSTLLCILGSRKASIDRLLG